MIQFRIAEILKEQDRSAYWLSQKMEMDYHNTKKLVDGKTNMVRLSTIEKLCDVLNVSIDQLFEQTNEN